MRKKMTKEVTYTTLKLAKMEVVDGQPETVEMEDEILLGNVNMEKAQKRMTKKHGQGVVVFEVQPETEKYEMEVERFIELADKVEQEN